MVTRGRRIAIENVAAADMLLADVLRTLRPREAPAERQASARILIVDDEPNNRDLLARRLEDVVGKTKTVPMDSDLLMTARALGVTFGD